MQMKSDKISEALRELLRISLGTADGSFDLSSLSEEEWLLLKREAEAQAVTAIVFDASEKAGVKLSEELYKGWFKASLSVISSSLFIARELSGLTGLLSENGIEYVILKGASSAYYYPDGDKRNVGDIDLYVKPTDTERTFKLLCEAGYEAEKDLSDIHYEFNKGRVRVELHKTFSGIPENGAGEYFSAALSDIVDCAVLVADEGFKRPSDFHHGIIIFLHTLHHMLLTGIGMRQFCDWAFFLFKTYNEPFWEEGLLPLFEKTGTAIFAAALTEAAVCYFNLPCPKWHKGAEPVLRDRILNEFLRSGNFGKKRTEDIKANVMSSKDSKPLGFFGKLKQMRKALNDTNKKVYPVLNRAPYLYPFIMLYRVARYFVLMLCGKKPSLREASRQATEKNKIFADFKLYE